MDINRNRINNLSTDKFIFILKCKLGVVILLKKLREEKEKNRLRFFTYSVYGGLLGIICVILLYIFFCFCTSGFNFNNVFIFGVRPAIIITGSMEPVVKVNGIVLLEPVKFEDIKIGDIVRYDDYRGFSVLHRVQTKTVSYLTTKGDANERPDDFVVTAGQITGRVISIHNWTADILTPIFGKFKYENMKGSMIRYGLGFVILITLFVLLVVLFIVIFEMITTVKFFKKYNKDLINSSNYWVDKIKSKNEEIEIFDKFFEVYNKSNLFKKIILSFELRRYYNGLCEIEKQVNKTDKRLVFLNWLMK